MQKMTSAPPNIFRPLTLENLLRFRGSRKASLALKIVRVIVGLEYGLVVALYGIALIFVANDYSEAWLTLPFAIIFGIIYYCLCGFGITMMGWGLEAVDDRAPIELWAFVAIGLAPISAIFYTCLAFYLLDTFSTIDGVSSGLLLLVPIAGFYFPFVLPTYWLRYHHRREEF